MKKSTIIMLVVAIVAVAGTQFGLVVIAAAILRSYPIPSIS